MLLLLSSPAVLVSVWEFLIGLGVGASYTFEPIVKAESAAPVTNQDAWRTRYATTTTATNTDGTTKIVGGWASHNLRAKVSAFVDGGGNFLASLGIPLKMSIAIMAVLVASFRGDNARYSDAIATVCYPRTGAKLLTSSR